MTQREIGALVERGLHSKGYLRQANEDPLMLNLYLNKSMDEILDTILEGLRTGSFEDSTIRIEDTRRLKGVTTLTKVVPNTSFLSGDRYSFSGVTDYRDWIKFRVGVTSEYSSGIVYTKVRIVDEEEVDDLMLDTYKTTSYDSPIATIVGSEIRVYTNGFTLSTGELMYLKKITKFDIVTNALVEYDAPPRIVNAVVDRTVELILKDSRFISRAS